MPTRPPLAKRLRVPGAQAPPRPRAPQAKTAARGYGSKWQKARLAFLLEHPRCECHVHKGRPDAPLAKVIDHIIPHQNNQKLFWDTKNWRAMTVSCHGRKTSSQDGGFGNKVRTDRPG